MNTNEKIVMSDLRPLQKKHLILDRPIVAAPLLFILSVLFMLPIQLAEPKEMSAFEEALFSLLSSASAGILTALFVRLRLRNGYRIGFTGRKLGSALLFCGFLFCIAGFNLLTIALNGVSYIASAEKLILAVMIGLAPGIYEELLFRGTIENLMLRKWKGTNAGIYCAVIVSALMFGLVHLMNAAVIGFGSGVLWQMAYSAAIGMLAGASYARTRNILGAVIAHAAIDFGAAFASLCREELLTSAAVESSVTISREDSGVGLNLIVIGICVAAALFLLRPSKLGGIRELWPDRVAPKKRPELEAAPDMAA